MAEMQLVLQRAIYSRHRKRGERGRAVRDGSTACPLPQGGGRAAACQGKPWGEVTTSEGRPPNSTSSISSKLHMQYVLPVMQTHPTSHPAPQLGRPQPHTFAGAECHSSPSRQGERLIGALLHSPARTHSCCSGPLPGLWFSTSLRLTLSPQFNVFGTSCQDSSLPAISGSFTCCTAAGFTPNMEHGG